MKGEKMGEGSLDTLEVEPAEVKAERLHTPDGAR
jgi:hypothetical protein